MAWVDVEKAKAKELLGGYLTHVPPKINGASIQQVIAFKDAVKKGKRSLAKTNVSLHELQQQINTLHRYWE
jgi:hypothetical protein